MTIESSSAVSRPGVAAPNYEVKLFLDPERVLDVEFKPGSALMSELKLKSSSRKISMQFIDARPCVIHAEGWNVRVRKFEDDEKFELSYKRRYSLGVNSLEAALAAAVEHGFTDREMDYVAQVEWGYGKRTLSFTKKKEYAARGYREMNLPAIEEVRRSAVEALPGKLDRWKPDGWARGVLGVGHLYGPVLGKRWTGRWDGPELSVEVWLVRTEAGGGYEPVVEASFKAEHVEEAGRGREALMKTAKKRGWLLERDVLKTEMILKRY